MKFLYTILLISIYSISLSQHDNQTNFGSIEEIPFSLEGRIYFPSYEIKSLPRKIDPTTAAGVIHTDKLDIVETHFKEGFPGVSQKSHNFIIDYQGFFYINKKQEGMHEFLLTSDDGSKLIIDESVIINNDGIHSFKGKKGKINLVQGVHKMRVLYFQGIPDNLGLELKFRKNSEDRFVHFSFSNHRPIKTHHSAEHSEGEVHLELENFLLFDRNSYAIKEASHQVLKEVYKSYMQGHKSKVMIVEGHTDLSGSKQYNASLSFKRAESVANYLGQTFDIHGRVLEIGFGEEKPRYSNDKEEDQKKNRRVEIRIMEKEKAEKYFSTMSSHYITDKK